MEQSSRNNKIVLVALILVVGLAVVWFAMGRKDTGMVTNDPQDTNAQMAVACQAKIDEQKDYLTSDTTIALSKQFTFDKYPANDVVRDVLTAPDFSSSPSAAMYRTKISEALTTSGLNFAGHYSMVSVPMTGMGDNYWLVDRTSGKIYEFPYKATYLDFKKESALIVINAKNRIEAGIAEMSSEPLNACANMGTNYRHVELRSTYLKWNSAEEKFEVLGGTTPSENELWDQF